MVWEKDEVISVVDQRHTDGVPGKRFAGVGRLCSLLSLELSRSDPWPVVSRMSAGLYAALRPPL